MRRTLLLASFALLASLAQPARAQFCPGAAPWVFDDVSVGDPFCGYITWAAQNGITLGCGIIDANHRLYCPNDGVNRSQMAAFLNRLGNVRVEAVGTGPGLTGGPITNAGTINLATTQLLPTTACASGQVAQWSGTAWVCANVSGGGSGTVTSVGSGTGLTGGPIIASGTLSIAASYQLPQSCTNGQVPKSNGAGGWTCQNDNDTNSGGTVTSLTAGTGITLTPSPITTTGSIAVNTVTIQQRVTGSCAVGSYIRAIAADGTVTCGTDNGGPASAFVQGGNAFGATAVAGTTDNNAFDVRVNNARVMRYEPNATSPNVLGGYAGNTADPAYYAQTIAGGGQPGTDCLGFPLRPCANRVSDNFATVGGGNSNNASAYGSTIAGGEGNTASSNGFAATIGGGSLNTASESGATIGGGVNNTASGWRSTVGGGGTTGSYCSDPPTLTNTRSCGNHATAEYATVGGGVANLAGNGLYTTVGGGASNTASGDGVSVGGGVANIANAPYSTVGGGLLNRANGQRSTAGGGQQNIANGDESTVGGGFNNTASVSKSTVGGGHRNLASGYASTVPGGWINLAQGAYSFAAGINAKALHDRSFVWGGSDVADTESSGPGVFTVYAPSSVQMYAGTVGSGGCILTSGASGWSCSSDRALKSDVIPVDTTLMLERVVAMPVSHWSFKSVPGVMHVGPMAQDFHSAFGLGDDDTKIAPMDVQGVALAAIQGLNAKLEVKVATQAREIEAAHAEIALLKSSHTTQIEELRRLVEVLLARTSPEGRIASK